VVAQNPQFSPNSMVGVFNSPTDNNRHKIDLPADSYEIDRLKIL
jgi:hypothetical protein